jgi:putative endonuclease
MKQPAIYIMTNKPNGTLYIGVTSHIVQRVFQHKHDVVDGFTHKYGCKQLVYYELHDTMEQAIHREKRLKKYKREQKIALIKSFNPDWRDLFEDIC